MLPALEISYSSGTSDALSLHKLYSKKRNQWTVFTIVIDLSTNWIIYFIYKSSWQIYIYFHLMTICLSLHFFIGWLLCFFPFHPQRWLNMPAALPPSCWGKPYPPSPRTWTLTPTACPSECVPASPLLTSLPWFLCGCSPSAWCAATPTWWSPLNGSQDALCSCQ